MKRKAVCIFALIAYVLLFCTCLAPVVEREMATLAEITHVKAKTGRNTTLPMSAYDWGEVQGLFQVKEGSGWNTGARVAEIPKIYYSVPGGFYSKISLHPENYDVILSASRVPKEGDRVEPVKPEDSQDEKLIVWCPEGYEEIVDRVDKFTVLGYGEKGILFSAANLKMPYFERYTVFSLENRLKADAYRVYSYSDAEDLLKALPLVAVYGAILLFAVVVWFGTCRMAKKEQPRWLLPGNAGVLALSLLGVVLLGKAVDLPASLMPPESILDFAHYRAEYDIMFAALREVGDKSLEILCVLCIVGAVVVLLLGVAAGVALLHAEEKKLEKLRIENGEWRIISSR